MKERNVTTIHEMFFSFAEIKRALNIPAYYTISLECATAGLTITASCTERVNADPEVVAKHG